MPLSPEIAAFYTKPAPMTDARDLDAALKDVPSDIPGMVAYIQNLLLHVHWSATYGIAQSQSLHDQAHIRSTHDMIATMQARDPRPLAFVRTPAQRAIGNCRHFSTFGTALFRRAGIPARARCGFGMYFEPGKGVDHWVIEYWNGTAWQLLDAQIDVAQRAILKLPFDPLNVPRDQFLTGGDAWSQCRAGKRDPDAFGIFTEKGYWFIAGNVIREVASLNSMELLPWDVWGGMLQPTDTLTPEVFAFYDRLSALTADPDKHFAELRAAYEDPKVHVPPHVFNFLRKQMEPV